MRSVFQSYLSCFIILFFFLLISSRSLSQQKENLGPMINSQYDELFPVLSLDGKTLYFDRKGSPENIGGDADDIWFSTLQSDGSWSRSQNVGEPLNDKGFNYVCSVTPDEDVFLLGNKYFSNGSQDVGASLTRRMGDRWTFPTNLNIQNFKNYASNSEYTMSSDGNVIIMSINPVDSTAPRDLYISFKKQGTTWSEPQNIGIVNTEEYDEITPFIAADNKTLFFSSNRPGGYGSYDIYVAHRTDDSWMFWTKPENIGPTVNTSEWEAYYIFPPTGKYAYFVSTAESHGGTDIFRIEIPERTKPTPSIIVRGKVLDPLSNPLGAAIRYERLSDAVELGTTQSHDVTGDYQISLPAGAKYGFRAEKQGYLPVNENIDLTNVSQSKEVHRDLVLVPIEKGKTVRMNNIFFEFDKATLTFESRAELDRLVEFLQSKSDINIQISGHTDNVGSDDYNLKLSQQRAQAVVDYLISKNIPASRLSAKGFGKTQPIESNESEMGRQKNRRVEFTIM